MTDQPLDHLRHLLGYRCPPWTVSWRTCRGCSWRHAGKQVTTTWRMD